MRSLNFGATMLLVAIMSFSSASCQKDSLLELTPDNIPAFILLQQSGGRPVQGVASVIIESHPLIYSGGFNTINAQWFDYYESGPVIIRVGINGQMQRINVAFSQSKAWLAQNFGRPTGQRLQIRWSASYEVLQDGRVVFKL